MVITTTQEPAFPPPPEGRGLHAVYLMNLSTVISISKSTKDNKPYVAVSNVSYHKGSPVLGASHPLTEIEARNIFGKVVAPKRQMSSPFLPENVLLWKEDFDYTCVFYVKAGLFEINHVNWSKPKKVPFPQLIFKVTKTSLHIFATKEGSKRPTPTTQLFSLPIWNVSDGSVCLGSASIPSQCKSLFDLVDGWKKVWFETTFSHDEHNTEKLWLSLEGKEKFPIKKLGQRLGTIEDII